MEIPHEYLCPISKEIMNEPVICSDGYTYERNMILNISNSISPITRELINKNNLIPNRNLKEAIERYKLLSNNNSVLDNKSNKKISNMSKLEKFEYEQKLIKLELLQRLEQERLDKDKRLKEIQLKKLQEEQENIKLNRILTMFNSQNITIFSYGNFSSDNHGMNGIPHLRFSFNKRGEHKYKFSLEFLKTLKNLNKEILSEKYKKILNDYIWIKKYVFGEETNPFVEFVFDKFIPNMDNYLEKYLKIIEKDDKIIRKSEKIYDNGIWNGFNANDNIYLQSKVKLINKINKRELKSKEYYITNYEDFCKDFSIPQEKNCKSYIERYKILNGKEFNIYQYWVKTKQKIFNSLINNIKENYMHKIRRTIYFKDDLNMVSCETTHTGNNTYKNNEEVHILDMYNRVVQASTQINYINEQFQQPTHLESDYKAKYFEPLMNLTKNIIELIDFLQEENN